MDKSKELYKKYPKIIGRGLTMGGVGDGWLPIVEEVCEKLERLEGVPKSFHFLQIKEKFGMLRMYSSVSTQETFDVIREAERKSATTCEFCGEPGKLRNTSWIKTLCDECDKERKQRLKQMEG